MDTRQAFLADILANPDSDTPRLIFADWLAEHGEEERAEFIRVQIAVASGNYWCDDTGKGSKEVGCFPWENGRLGRLFPCEYCRMRLHERVLWDGNARTQGNGNWKRFIIGLPSIEEAPVLHPNFVIQCGLGTTKNLYRYTFRRGFVEEVSCTLTAWLERGPTLASRHPIREVRITDRQPAVFGSDDRDAVGDIIAPHWVWAKERHLFLEYRHEIALPVWDYMDSDGRSFAEYPSERAAIDTLSAACIQWARAQK